MKTALVVGMALSGIASAKLLKDKGYRVIVNDTKSEIPGLWEKLVHQDYVDALGQPVETLLPGTDLLVLSPGVPMDKPFIFKAKEMGIEIVGEIELGYRHASCAEYWCITGTNGKTTCTALTGEVFKAGGRNTFVLGNIGDPITAHAQQVQPGDVIVAETAALQLEGNSTFHARGAAVCNITEDHLDRFKTMENYIAAKCKIFENQTADDFAVLNYDDPVVREMYRLTAAKVLYFSRKTEVEQGVYCVDGRNVYYRLNKGEEPVFLCRREEIQIPGPHNLENAMLCAAMGLCGGVSAEAVVKALKEFPGVEHRIEFVCERQGVAYINDSKGTNPDSTMKAIAAMQRPTVLLLGGYDKHNEFGPLFDAFDNKVKAVIALGATAEKILAAAKAAGFTDIYHCKGSFREAVDMARDLAVPGDAVLLSPACASWDMFPNFEVRGRDFKDIARAYPQ